MVCVLHSSTIPVLHSDCIWVRLFALDLHAADIRAHWSFCGALYQQHESLATLPARLIAVTMVTAGAIGNLLDRIRTDLGVVDFIDVGFGNHRWPTFNVADMAVSGGAFLLAWVLWGEDRKESAGLATNAVAVQTSPAASTITGSDLGDSN